MSTYICVASVRRIGVCAAAIVSAVAVLYLLDPAASPAAGHSPYSYKKGSDCKPGPQGRNILDPVSVQLIGTTYRTVASMNDRIRAQSFSRHQENDKIPIWGQSTAIDDDVGQEGAYIDADGDRVCSSFSRSNATGAAIRSRYHMRLHTAGPSSAHPGERIVAGTAHYDLMCGRIPKRKHEVKTFAGARTEFLRLWPKSRFRQYSKFEGNTHQRWMKCQEKWVKSDGYVAFIFIG